MDDRSDYHFRESEKMIEYIERNAFKEKYLCCGYIPEMSEKEFDDFPVELFRERVNGNWLRENNREKSYIRVCSVCRKTAYCCTPIFHYKFCPNCGADMRGNKSE